MYNGQESIYLGSWSCGTGGVDAVMSRALKSGVCVSNNGGLKQ